MILIYTYMYISSINNCSRLLLKDCLLCLLANDENLKRIIMPLNKSIWNEKNTGRAY
jgi:hypothetical protein